jgi:16S rRNA (uracil1498-N3)-methyltransferase
LPADAAPAFVWVADLGASGDRLPLGEPESRYVARVCRARVGEPLTLTDGRGGLARTRIESLGRPVVVVVDAIERALARRSAEVLCGRLESERGDWLVEKLAELGVAVFQPVHCERATWPGTERRARWARVARAALQQSRGRFELEVRVPVPLEEAVAAIGPGACRFVADPGGESAGRMARPETEASAVVVGPSEGLSPAELSSLSGHGFRPISLSNTRLRTETAAVVWAAWWATPGEHGDSREVEGPES